MKVIITATENAEKLRDNISKRVESSELENGKLTVETDKSDFLRITPGIDSYKENGVEHQGIGGKPVDEEAYAKLETREDAVKCLLATIQGYDLRILNTGRDWDLRQLKKYNPDIKHLKFDEPKEFLKIEKSVCELEETETIDIPLPSDGEVEMIYRNRLT